MSSPKNHDRPGITDKSIIKVHFYKGTAFFSRLIQWRTFSPYSHVSISHESIIYEAVEGVWVRAVLARELPPKSLADTIEIEVPQDQLKEALVFAINQLGKPYNWVGIFLYFWFNFPNKKKWNSWYCSEFAVEFLERCGIIEKQKYQHSPGSLQILISGIYKK